ncbi:MULTISPECIES: hypothetical protein [Micromonospora]|uniref:hypothetical protein n=1 Tax=Micromonospora TaxID=1873 RepID=UPI00098CF76A|nr:MULTISPECIES: hypothetical protein [unclassified Micromonospora]OON33125.1 hypothetical protein BSA16_02025 [Micromonospora sp. Rc5]
MVMVILPAARRHHRSRTIYAFGLLALLGAATTLGVVVRYPTLSATELAAPVPAPEITVVDEEPEPDWAAPADPPAVPGPVGAGADAAGVPTGPPAGAGAGAGTDPVVEAGRAAAGPTSQRDETSRSLFWSGLLGLAISLAGLGLVGTRRRMW